MIKRVLLTGLALALAAASADAGPLRRLFGRGGCGGGASYQHQSYSTQSYRATASAGGCGVYQTQSSSSQSFQSYQAAGFVAGGAQDALAEVNAQRAARGLRPFLPDPGLTVGAMRAAAERARRGLFGHLPNDFVMLPPGAHARAGGCAARGPGEPFAACCVLENWTYAGAATVVGPNGTAYHHIFVR